MSDVLANEDQMTKGGLDDLLLTVSVCSGTKRITLAELSEMGPDSTIMWETESADSPYRLMVGDRQVGSAVLEWNGTRMVLRVVALGTDRPSWPPVHGEPESEPAPSVSSVQATEGVISAPEAEEIVSESEIEEAPPEEAVSAPEVEEAPPEEVVVAEASAPEPEEAQPEEVVETEASAPEVEEAPPEEAPPEEAPPEEAPPEEVVVAEASAPEVEEAPPEEVLEDIVSAPEEEAEPSLDTSSVSDGEPVENPPTQSVNQEKPASEPTRSVSYSGPHATLLATFENARQTQVPNWVASLKDATVQQRWASKLSDSFGYIVANYPDESAATDEEKRWRKWVEPELLPGLDNCARFLSALCADAQSGHTAAGSAAIEVAEFLFDSIGGLCAEYGWFTLTRVMPYETSFDPLIHQAAGPSVSVQGVSGTIIEIIGLGVSRDGTTLTPTRTISSL